MQGLMRVRHLSSGDVYFGTFDKCCNPDARFLFDRNEIERRLDWTSGLNRDTVGGGV